MEHLGNHGARHQNNEQANRGADFLRAGRATSKPGSLQNTFEAATHCGCKLRHFPAHAGAGETKRAGAAGLVSESAQSK